MNVNFYFIVALLPVVGFFLIIISTNLIDKNVERNLQIAAKLLNSRIEKSLFRKTVRGHYKGREVAFIGHSGVFKGRMLPLRFAKKPKLFSILGDSPTEKTTNEGKYVESYYFDTLKDNKVLITYTEQDLINILDNLFEAAEVVEKGQEYYSDLINKRESG